MQIRARFYFRCGVVASVAALGVTCLSETSLGSSQPSGPVSATPASGTPSLATTGSTEQIRQLVQCGGTMYAVGSFTEISWAGTTYDRNNIFSFSATSPFTVTSWNPDVNGTVNSIAFDGTNCADAYIGGQFTSVGTTSVKNIAELDTTAGAIVTAFGHNASGKVETLLGAGGHIIVGGYYTSINGSTADPYMTSLSPSTGRDDGFIHLGISGHYDYNGVTSSTTNIYNQALSSTKQYDLVMGDFLSVGGLPRQQIFMLNLSDRARVCHRVDVSRVGRQPGREQPASFERIPLPVRPQRVVLHPSGLLVTGRPDDLHRHHRLPRERLSDGSHPPPRPLRRGCSLPGHGQPAIGLRAAQLGQLHRL